MGQRSTDGRHDPGATQVELTLRLARATPEERLLHWVEERERIRLRKEAWEKKEAELRGYANHIPHGPSVFTDDPILATYRFCNVRREDDRVTRWIRTNVRERYAGHPLMWLMMCICRHFNWPPTIEALLDTDGWPDSRLFSPYGMMEALQGLRLAGGKMYTGAYVVPAPSKGGSKAAWSCEVAIGELHRRRDRFADIRELRAPMELVHRVLTGFEGWGPFLAYQAVVDMRFTEVLRDAPDRATWCAVGPGTLRGLNRLHGRPVDQSLTGLSSDRVQAFARAEAVALYHRLGVLTDVAMDLSDVPNVLCEFDKYERVRLGEGRPRALYVPGRGS